MALYRGGKTWRFQYLKSYVNSALIVCWDSVAAESVDEAGAIPFTHLTSHQSANFFLNRHHRRQSSSRILLHRTILQWTLPLTWLVLCTG